MEFYYSLTDKDTKEGWEVYYRLEQFLNGELIIKKVEEDSNKWELITLGDAWDLSQVFYVDKGDRYKNSNKKVEYEFLVEPSLSLFCDAMGFDITHLSKEIESLTIGQRVDMMKKHMLEVFSSYPEKVEQLKNTKNALRFFLDGKVVEQFNRSYPVESRINPFNKKVEYAGKWEEVKKFPLTAWSGSIQYRVRPVQRKDWA